MGNREKSEKLTARRPGMMRYRSYPFFHYQFGKMLEGPVVGFFRVFRETARWKFPALQMIRETVAANTFAAAWTVCTVTFIEIFFFFAIHDLFPSV